VPPLAGDSSHLDPPPAGQGFQLQSDDTSVPQGTEEQDCYFFEVGAVAKAAGMDPAAPLDLHRVQIAQRPGSHHMNLFRVRTVVKLGPATGRVQKGTNGVGECFKSSNWADWPLVANSQKDGQVDWTYPEGVANVIQPGEWLMLQTHYVNASTQKTPEDVGHVSINLWTMPAADVKAELGTLFATDQSIRVCRGNPTPTFTASCQIDSPRPVHIIGANGHFHSRGTQFDMYLWDGKSLGPPRAASKFYESDTWDDPPMPHSPGLDVTVPAFGGVLYTCSYQWVAPDAASGGCGALDQYDEAKNQVPPSQLDCCYAFGPSVDENEHCNAFVYYYPKADDVNCF
jgi:hypothetical protein